MALSEVGGMAGETAALKSISFLLTCLAVSKKARAAKLSAAERSRIAKLAVAARERKRTGGN